MGKELAEVVVENGIVYHLREGGLYHPDLRLPEGTHYNIDEYELINNVRMLRRRLRCGRYDMRKRVRGGKLPCVLIVESFC